MSKWAELVEFCEVSRNSFSAFYLEKQKSFTVKLGKKERFDKEQIGINEPFPMTDLPFTS